MKKIVIILISFFTTIVSAQKVKPKIETITLGGGCFWCIEAVFDNLDGVISAESGYSGGNILNPTYEQVSTGDTGFAEAVQIKYDSTKTNLDEIFKVFFTVHDPTTVNRQGADMGSQYRSVIFYANENQKKMAKDLIEALEKSKAYRSKIVTTLEPFKGFTKAENYHQNYYENNKMKTYCQYVIQPKLEKFEKVFKDRLKKKK
ncbi:peptide-methionine (S)-S-oxide reductase MsrA [Flavobacterium oreochromis]|uniref:Peptide methionine sulfoxide reductase MsrA n=2 Tax=Flavobacterium TaxID=237 RepID=A0A246G914_9FLAO|nr:peptide-methionine (S)-S-oxide reductase MsrA [Flavobacterium oreochromis]OWP75337.1 peptide-methionine (S)-S-oxide reductase [Flavobacterium oreochromis]OWP75808.1 peptide-methionine (S)-S-oxide reductase [Flavobacterium oreochromis]POR23969.1 peptide-methionine (S)-S-oxide reductase [Flavobacterium columnare]QYS86530.1 peptide-methionine (S)-S-oxide reductase MsrA [Flavobacterium oreochromis]